MAGKAYSRSATSWLGLKPIPTAPVSASRGMMSGLFDQEAGIVVAGDAVPGGEALGGGGGEEEGGQPGPAEEEDPLDALARRSTAAWLSPVLRVPRSVESIQATVGVISRCFRYGTTCCSYIARLAGVSTATMPACRAPSKKPCAASAGRYARTNSSYAG